MGCVAFAYSVGKAQPSPSIYTQGIAGIISSAFTSPFIIIILSFRGSAAVEQETMKYLPTKQQVKSRLKDWELPKQDSTLAPENVWTNADMDPVKPENRTWTIWTWMAYWASDVINLGTWETASGILAVGLSWREAIPIMLVGITCVTIPVVFNGAIGAKLHIPFSVIVRSSFGYYFAYFCIASRAVLAMFWLGIQGANGAQCVTIMLLAIAPSYANIPNTMAASSGITSQGMVSYFLFWIIQLPILLVPPTKLHYLFIIKLIIAPICAICTLAWCVHKAGSVGDIFGLEATVSGSSKAWLWLTCMSSVTGSWATLACNIPDFSRYAKSSRGQYIQLPFLPLIFTLCGIFGIVTTSASKIIYGEYLWNPLDIIAHWLDNGPGGRAAAFFAALSWYLNTIGVNVAANSISASNDLTVMFPRYVNIKRGCIVAAVIGGWLFVPWKILTSAETFLNFMGGYAVFMAPIAGVMLADYWLVKSRNVDVPALYDPQGRYRYDGGINWRAAVAFLLAVIPNLPGLANSISPTTIFVSDGARNLYSFGWLYGFVMSIVLYTVLSKLFPAAESLIGSPIYGNENDEIIRSGKEESSAEKGSAENDSGDIIVRCTSTGNTR